MIDPNITRVAFIIPISFLLKMGHLPERRQEKRSNCNSSIMEAIGLGRCRPAYRQAGSSFLWRDQPDPGSEHWISDRNLKCEKILFSDQLHSGPHGWADWRSFRAEPLKLICMVNPCPIAPIYREAPLPITSDDPHRKGWTIRPSLRAEARFPTFHTLNVNQQQCNTKAMKVHWLVFSSLFFSPTSPPPTECLLCLFFSRLSKIRQMFRLCIINESIGCPDMFLPTT